MTDHHSTQELRKPTREEAIRAAARILVAARADLIRNASAAHRQAS